MKIHLDTDLGGDIDDLCALALLLRWPDVEITGITTAAEDGGRRAGYVRRVLALEGREEIPVAAGANAALGGYRDKAGYLDEQTYWGEPIAPSPNSLEQALLLLKQSIDQGAIVVGIGPYTNLYLLEKQSPGILQSAQLVLMGGYIYPPREGFPQWGNNMDYNVQVDARSARYVFEHSSPTLVPLSVTVETSLRRTFLPALRKAGSLGQLVARQAEAFAADRTNANTYGQTWPNLPYDLINFLHDPLACAVALGWKDGVEIAQLPLGLESRDRRLYETIDPSSKAFRVVTRVDGSRFSEFWAATVAAYGWRTYAYCPPVRHVRC